MTKLQNIIYNASNLAAITYVDTIGVTGVWGNDFGHFRDLISVAVDPSGRIYVIDDWGYRVQVFDSDGDYLTTLGASWGGAIGDLRDAYGLAFDASGNLYVADSRNHRIQKFAPGVLGWSQVNLNGFGDPDNWGAWSLGVYSDAMYVGAGNRNGTEIWRYASGIWERVVSGGFGDGDNVAVDDFVDYGGNLYAGTWVDGSGGQIWRSSTGNSGTWSNVVPDGFGDSENLEVDALLPYKGYLYAGTLTDPGTGHGGEIWRSSSGVASSWTPVLTDTVFGESDNAGITVLEVFSNTLYAGTANNVTGAELWRTTNGLNWTQVYTDGFGSADNSRLVSLEVFNNKFYTGLYDPDSGGGGELWRSSDGAAWSHVNSDGFGNTDNLGPVSLVSFDGYLYALTSNRVTGPEVWRSSSGDAGSWERVADTGFGNGRAHQSMWDYQGVVYNANLYFSGWARGDAGGEVWLLLHERQYLPVVFK